MYIQAFVYINVFVNIAYMYANVNGDQLVPYIQKRVLFTVALYRFFVLKLLFRAERALSLI